MKKKHYYILISMFLILFIAGCADDESEQKEEEFQESAEKDANIVFAEEFVMFLNEGRYEDATEYYDETMKDELPASELEEAWTSLEEQFGSFVSQEYQSTEKLEGYDVVLINGSFEEQDVVFQITLDQNEKIAGFYVK
ncbi:DUF3887 domain-containing protein [Oceanobacillus bengalensis]|uniref:DUF3887 domain-containing protein n=1 Tax=Oceanobacillus bengalensis TaxID=1435466 RepID=A0A494Z4U6_9BACI|nr:DUF3887 domain-containing protein [Oceanobacillus bengalensis]RKQ17529.1 DUF3887 domain-containing protein [Oceanobacillus bengalensis]